MIVTITLDKNTFDLHHTGVLFWKEKNALLVSDVHLGKVSHFRKHGVAVPENVVNKNFEQLDYVIDYFNPQIIIFLGDLFHSKKNKEWDLFAEWSDTVPIPMVLIEGNHDIIAKHHYEILDIKVCSELILDNFLLTHHPELRDGFFNFCGHIHPAVQLRGTGRQSLKLPCFFQRGKQMVLPAFGAFTGTYFLIPEQHDCVYALAKEEVIQIC